MLSYWLFRFAAVAVPLLPQAWLSGLANLLGAAAYVFAGSARRTALLNITPVVPVGCRSTTVRGMFVHNAQYYLSLFARRPNKLRLTDHELVGWQHFSEALAGGRGCILVSPHLGDINYYAELFLASGLPVNVVVENLRPPALSNLLVDLRGRRGVGVIVGGAGALKQVYQALARNEIVGMISDRDIMGDGYPVRFFGRETTMPGAAFAVAARRRVPVVLGSAVRLPNDRVVADVRPPFITDGNLAANVQRMAGVFEEFIGRFPDHWLAFQPIFKEPAAAACTTGRARVGLGAARRGLQNEQDGAPDGTGAMNWRRTS